MAPSDPAFPDSGPSPHARLVSGLSPAQPTAFEIVPDAAARAEVARRLGLSEVRKLRFTGEITAEGKRDWRLGGTLGATIVQPCVVTLEPVVTRIDAPVTRRFLARWEDVPEAGSETEAPEDDTLEPLGSHIDPWGVMCEALALEAPDFPRAPEAGAPEPVSVTEPGKTAMSDDDVKPFAGLAALKAKLEGGSDDETE
jgi:uncharacterized metal-binding protein YceD (DUF177 family)